MSVFPLTAASDCHAAMRDLIKGCYHKTAGDAARFLAETVTTTSASSAPTCTLLNVSSCWSCLKCFQANDTGASRRHRQTDFRNIWTWQVNDLKYKLTHTSRNWSDCLYESKRKRAVQPKNLFLFVTLFSELQEVAWCIQPVHAKPDNSLELTLDNCNEIAIKDSIRKQQQSCLNVDLQSVKLKCEHFFFII